MTQKYSVTDKKILDNAINVLELLMLLVIRKK